MIRELISLSELRQALDKDVKSFSSEPLQSAARGYMSDVYRLELKTEQGQETLILKTESSDPSRKAIAERFGSYRHEQRFYSELTRDLPFKVPQCYFNAEDRFLLILEDLGDDGVVGTSGGVSQSQANAAIKTLARIHGHFYRQPPTPEENISVALKAAATDMSAFVLEALQQHKTRLNAAQDLAIRYASNSQDYIALYQEQEQVFTHMDFRTDNLRFLEDLVVLDWGESTHAPLGFDLAGFMINSIAQENRKQWEEDMLVLYLKILSDSGAKASQNLLDSYRLALLPALYLPGLVRAHGNQEEGDLLIERALAAINDHLPYLLSVFD